MNGISVIVCCYNSALKLPETLKHLARQLVPATVSWEVLIINNNSTDNTAAVAKSEWLRYSVKATLKIIDEQNPGLSYARLRGAKEAAFGYIIFCDDDNWLEENYLSTALSVMYANEKIGALGGQSEACFENDDRPQWFSEEQGSFAVGKQARQTGNITVRGYVWGSGMVTRRSLYLKAFSDIPSLLSDRKGGSLSSGGDSEYCHRLMLMNYSLWYDESLQFIHYIPANRLTECYKSDLQKAFNESHYITILYYLMIVAKNASLLAKCILFGKALVKFIASSFRLFKRTTPAYEKLVMYFISGAGIIQVPSEAKAIYRFASSVTK